MAPATAEPKKVPVTELERQESTIAQLGDDYEFPLFSGRHAVESQRKSGYKDTARAAREIVDNAYEARASEVHVVFERHGDSGRGDKGQKKDTVTSIAFIDDGPGMLPKMARFALSWGGGTRFDSPTGIGRFGFGLPNASINQTRRVEVYTRTDASLPWTKVVLDINKEKLGKKEYHTGIIKVDEPVEDELPAFVREYLKSNKIDLGTGTIVTWVKPDRLSKKSASHLRELLLDDFGVVYRYLLPNFKLIIDNRQVQPLDPLFLTPGARYYLPPEQGGAIKTLEKRLFVKYYRDPATGAQHLERLTTPHEVEAARNDNSVEAVGKIEVTMSRFPYGFSAERIYTEEAAGQVGIPKDSDAYRRNQIRKKRRGVTYVRAGREIDFVDNLPRTDSDKGAGLGRWPVQQAYSSNYGLELSFDPTLDEAFGIGNDKQTVNPTEDVWRVLTEAEIDRAVREENDYQRRTRTAAKERAQQVQRENLELDPVPAIAAQADMLTVRKVSPSPETDRDRQQRRDQVVKERRKERPEASEDVLKKEMEEEAKKKPFGVGFFESEGGVFLKPDFGNSMQRMAIVNTAHPFYKAVYTRLIEMRDPMPRQAVDLLLIALVKAELDANKAAGPTLKNTREDEWSPFLKNAYALLDEIEAQDPDDAEEAEENTDL